MTTFNHRRDTSQNLLVNCHNSRSKAKTTIEHYTNFDAIPTLRHIVTKLYGIQYHKNLAMVTLANGLLILADIWRIDLLLAGFLFVLIRVT